MNFNNPDCSLIIPTLNRSAVLADTLQRIVSLPDRALEVIVVDNGSTDDTGALAGKFPGVRWIMLGANLGCAARNVAAAAARGRVLLMLDDDSRPEPGAAEECVRRFDNNERLGAIQFRVRLADPPHRHDAGGVPGIFFNCGGAVRRDAFLHVGGFPVDFDYYVEEYDLCCRLIRRGWRVEPHGDLVAWHRRVTRNRDNNRMLRLLVRNNLRLWNRYAPETMRAALMEQTIERYRRVAVKENALAGYQAGLEEGRRVVDSPRSRRHPLSRAEFRALFGLDVAQESLVDWADNKSVRCAAVWGRGKGCEQLIDATRDVNISVDVVFDAAVESSQWRGIPLRPMTKFDPASRIDGVIIGSLSPGVAQDLADDFARDFPDIPVLSAAPWRRTSEHRFTSVEPARAAAGAVVCTAVR